MGGVSQYFSKVLGPGVDSTLPRVLTIIEMNIHRAELIQPLWVARLGRVSWWISSVFDLFLNDIHF